MSTPDCNSWVFLAPPILNTATPWNPNSLTQRMRINTIQNLLVLLLVGIYTYIGDSQYFVGCRENLRYNSWKLGFFTNLKVDFPRQDISGSKLIK